MTKWWLCSWWHDKYDVLFLSTSLKPDEIVEKKIEKGKERIKVPIQITYTIIWNFSDQWQEFYGITSSSKSGWKFLFRTKCVHPKQFFFFSIMTSGFSYTPLGNRQLNYRTIFLWHLFRSFMSWTWNRQQKKFACRYLKKCWSNYRLCVTHPEE
jgi:hypothetical protein